MINYFLIGIAATGLKNVHSWKRAQDREEALMSSIPYLDSYDSLWIVFEAGVFGQYLNKIERVTNPPVKLVPYDEAQSIYTL